MTQPKWLLLILFGVAVAGVLLSLRHQRLQVMHETIQTHRQIDRVGQELWDLQVRMAETGSTEELQEDLRRSNLDLTPIATQVPPRRDPADALLWRVEPTPADDEVSPAPRNVP